MEPLHLRATVLPDAVDRDVFIRDGTITFAEQAGARTVLDRGWLIPGLVDAHAHLSLASPVEGSPEDRVRASAAAHLDAGVLLIREPGSPDRASFGLGPAEGLPRTITAGRFLAPPGRYFPGLAREVAEDELPDAAAEEARASGAWVKVIGDFPDDDGLFTPNYAERALEEAARRAHAAGARITMHAVVAASIERAIAAGFDAIEHATMLTQDLLADLTSRGIALVPTMTIRGGIVQMLSGLGIRRDQASAIEGAVREQPERVRQAVDAGVTVIAGTDAGMVPHGSIAHEVANLIEAGIDPGVALGAASWTARTWLGVPGIEEGAPADLVAFPDDPRGDPEVLGRASLIVLAGVPIATPGGPARRGTPRP